jgi:NADH:quinone reductase (non-electrogenic)
MTSHVGDPAGLPNGLPGTEDTDVPVVVLGGGYAGVTAALRLSRSQRVTLVDAAGTFTERMRLHEAAAGRPPRAIPLAELVAGRDITTVAARAVAIDPTARTVRLDNGTLLGYRTLVYALGSTTNTRAMPGAAEHAFAVEHAAALHDRIATGTGSLAIVGGGLTGIEVAAALAETNDRWKITLVTGGEIGGGMSAKARRHIAASLRRLDVTQRTQTRVIAVLQNGLATDQGDIPADLVVWTGSFTVPALAAEAGLAVDDHGRALVDHALRSVSHPDVFVVGDAATITVPGTGALRMAVATAMPAGAHAAESIEAIRQGREPKPFRFRFVGQAISLGQYDGVFQPTHADDSPHGLVLTGRPAAHVKEWINRYTLSALRAERRRPGSYRWVKRFRTYTS